MNLDRCVACMLAFGLRAHVHLDVDVQRVGDIGDGIQLHVAAVAVQQSRDDRRSHADSACELGLGDAAARTDLIKAAQQFGEGNELGDLTLVGGTLLVGRERLVEKFAEFRSFVGSTYRDTSFGGGRS